MNTMTFVVAHFGCVIFISKNTSLAKSSKFNKAAFGYFSAHLKLMKQTKSNNKRGEIDMSIELFVDDSFVTGKNEKKQLFKHFMEDYDDRFKKLWLYRKI